MSTSALTHMLLAHAASCGEVICGVQARRSRQPRRRQTARRNATQRLICPVKNEQAALCAPLSASTSSHAPAPFVLFSQRGLSFNFFFLFFSAFFCFFYASLFAPLSIPVSLLSVSSRRQTWRLMLQAHPQGFSRSNKTVKQSYKSFIS